MARSEKPTCVDPTNDASSEHEDSHDSTDRVQ
jgi:hypothetical protein